MEDQEKQATFEWHEPNPKMHQSKLLLSDSDQRKWAELYLWVQTDYSAMLSHSGLELQRHGFAGRKEKEVSWKLETGEVTDKGSDRQTPRTNRRQTEKWETWRKREPERQGKEDMKEWPVGMNGSCEDVSGSCLRINPAVSGKQSTNTLHPTSERRVLRQLKGNIIKMQMWPIYQGAKAHIKILCVCVCTH